MTTIHHLLCCSLKILLIVAKATASLTWHYHSSELSWAGITELVGCWLAQKAFTGNSKQVNSDHLFCRNSSALWQHFLLLILPPKVRNKMSFKSHNCKLMFLGDRCVSISQLRMSCCDRSSWLCSSHCTVPEPSPAQPWAEGGSGGISGVSGKLLLIGSRRVPWAAPSPGPRRCWQSRAVEISSLQSPSVTLQVFNVEVRQEKTVQLSSGK